MSAGGRNNMATPETIKPTEDSTGIALAKSYRTKQLKKYYAELCAHEESWVHEQLAEGTIELETKIKKLKTAIQAIMPIKPWTAMDEKIWSDVASALEDVKYY